MAVDKELAQKLKEQGMSYPEISSEVGCSVDWCKKNLKDIIKNKQEKEVVKEAVLKAKSKRGVTVSELKDLVKTIYTYENTKEYKDIEDKAVRRFKVAINKHTDTTVRPYWMCPENATLSFNLVLSAVDCLTLRMNDEVENIRKVLDYDGSYDMSIRYSIIKMLLGSNLTPEGLGNHCEQLMDIVQSLEGKNS
jgi:hypothetical protein